MTAYPTKKQILKRPRPKFPPGLLSVITFWKRFFYKNWNKETVDNKFALLTTLAVLICDFYQKNPVEIIQGRPTRYIAKDNYIILTEPSIISLLHELAHHLFGKSELQACRWSVWLYQLRFRKDYQKLVWQEHMLVKPPSKVGTKKLE